MNRNIFLISGAFVCLALSYVNLASAQTYTLSSHLEQRVKKDTGGDVMQIQLTNTTSTDLTIKWKMLDNTIQWTGWQYGYCDLNTCYTATAQIPNETSNLIDPKGVDAFSVSISSYSGKATTGRIQIALWDVNHPADIDTILFLIDGTHMGIGSNEVPASSVNFFPDPAVNSLNFTVAGNEFEPVKATVFSMTGQRMFEQKILPGAGSIDIDMLANGMYYVRLEDKAGNGLVKSFIAGN